MIREIQIKMTLRVHLTPVRIIIIKNTSKNKWWQGYGEKCSLTHCWGECKLVQPLWKAIWRFLRKLGIETPFDPVIPLLGLYPETLKTTYYCDTVTSMFIAGQFTIAKPWNQCRCPSTDEWIKKCGIYKQWNITEP